MKIRNNIVQVLFLNEKEISQFMKGGAWYFNNHFLALQKWDRSKDFLDKSFNEVYF